MSLSRRILEGAQSQWAKLTSLVIVDDEPLSHVDSTALSAELSARKAARAGAITAPAANPVAALAGAEPAQRTARHKAAAERGARIGKERSDRAAKEKASSDEAFRRMKQQAATASSWSTGGAGAAASGSTTGTRASNGSAGRTAPTPGRNESELADWYKTLGVTPGDDMPKIKTAYRQLMRKYHPDMHAHDPKKQKAANELSMKVTTAYNSLVDYMAKK
ncbi:MAG: DnaJ domain-containing protein [Kofleriaceae bacterium]|nr:DnaJ domain-containing protein [Kofleriaceae bacterium]